jgi:polyphenol oxidase
MLNQVHGAVVHRVSKPGEHDGLPGDALVTTEPDLVLGIWHGDCASVTFAGGKPDGSGVLGVAHAGWRGLADGVLSATVSTMRSLGATTITTEIGPHIGPCCYEFGHADLATVAASIGVEPEVITGRSRGGHAALDVAAAVKASLAQDCIEVTSVGPCTGCGAATYWSHRSRQETGRQVTAAWMSSAGMSSAGMSSTVGAVRA